MFTRYDGSPSGRVSTSEVQSYHQNRVTGPTRPLNSARVCKKPDDAQHSLRKSKHRQTTFWKTVGTVLGFFLTALFAALGHFMLVKHLSGRPVDTSFLTQTQVSAVSILLSTIFKAALTASMGMCFAQHLWYLLRGTAMSLSTVEMLFVIRTNILALLNPHGIRRAPLLFLMALLIWCIGLATIYPPGALIVVFQAQEFTESRNLSVMNPPLPLHLDLAGDDNFPTLSGDALSLGAMGSAVGEPENPPYRYFSYGQPLPALMFIAQAIVFNNQMFTLPGYPGENSTYRLQFRGPRFRCTTAQYNSTLPLDYISPSRLQAPIFTTAWDQERLMYMSKQCDIANYTVQRDPSIGALVWAANCVVKEQICIAESVLYNISVMFPRGIQTVDYSFSGSKALSRKADALGAESRLELELPPKTQAFQDWYRELSTIIPVSNEWAILDAMGALIEGTSFQLEPVPSRLSPLPGHPPLESVLGQQSNSGTDCQQRENPSSPTLVYDCGTWFGGYDYDTPNSLLKGTVFHTTRFDRHPRDEMYDPRKLLNITEAMLNEVLVNITISAISLGTWWDMVPVTSTRYRSTYKLSNPLNLILPYSICLAAATVFMAIAIWSLWRNRAPAADGGFLQIMMATVGDTQMSRVILEEKLAAVDDISDELKSLKIRYGKLVNADVLGKGGKQFGFGTMDETIPLRKRT
ncbi:hypothetical protein BKA58DRAFT_385377 [Alternaria rosae]|uniref:uncharacterized protein n=1 Tax=Alternaria rosae TaxID=1187941 RepID=UPI001E8E67AB|nr:uncharacterized protein BKA58DRAFT_385377 [Alternaria rosae]KAH6870614.1 hypothetical protein BKA58DRAFT_385377 [Alternaria rosae]